MRKLKKKPRDPHPDTRAITVTFKVNAEEMRNILGRAHSLTYGNVSEYVRFSALNFKPLKSDLQ